MKLSNVIGFGTSVVICAGLLTACADGRGTNGFKSYQYSQSEKEQNKLKRDGAKPNPNANQNQGTDDSAKTGDLGIGSSTVLPPAPDRGLEQPVFTPPPAPAQNAVIIEQGPANPSGVTDLSARVQDLNVTIEGELNEADKTKPNEVAKKLVLGISASPKGSETARTISLMANIIIDGKEVVMEAVDVPVKFLKPEERMSNILFTLTSPCDGKTVVVKNMLQAGVKCSDQKCNGIDLILSFETQNPQRRANAILIMAQQQGKWNFIRTNIGAPKSFEQSQASCQAPAPEAARPASPSTTTPIAPGLPAPAPAAAPAVPRQSMLDECMKKDAEGFSVCDSETEKNAMRRLRRAEAARAEAARTEAPRTENQDRDANAIPPEPSVPKPAAPAVETHKPAAPVIPANP